MAIRLINTKNLCLEFFMGSNTPQFAILSHTWEGNGEISFQEMLATKDDLDHSSKRKSGFTKIVNTCRKARHDKIDYVWVDTCCIDKTSSSELSEAINSMYRWYQKAIVCYVLLSDFDASLATVEKDLSKCRWFTRGWCLQELIAPQQVEFFDLHWRQIGSKAELGPLISKITRIDENVLVDNSLIQFVPVARRMSWIAGRETTREEDMAYCLLGIFDVSMPMLYGEGTKAFMRLQEEIIKTSNDLSIFAFLHGPALSSTDKSAQIYHDLFAKSPRDFIGCKDLVSATAGAHSNSTFALTNKGLPNESEEGYRHRYAEAWSWNTTL
ncbi:hypothetical protein BDZ45DRAFT_718127 [Acephala macrosclerotiorum]|nr:hypothetical protein BDZ45DRAFT_718127 [Acephala macrosclerotiorum]